MPTYKKGSSPMMHRPVVKEELVEFMRERQIQLTGHLKELEEFSAEHYIPIIPHETVVYFQFMISLMHPQSILEIGTAVGFSALMMAESAPNAKITTIDRNPEMIEHAKRHFELYDSRHQIQLLEGDATDVLKNLEGKYDIIFMDSAKSKYVEYLPIALELLTDNGVIIMDDIFQSGEILWDIMDIKRGQRALQRGLRKLFDEVLDNPSYQSSILPLGDGMLLIKKP